jgi:signal transduction histidine kinase
MGTGDFIKKPDRRLKLLVITQGLWMVTLLVLAMWWGTLLHQKSDEIADLQTQLGVPESQVQSRLAKTERMIAGESGTFVLMILIANGVLLMFFYRDTKRSKSIEAFFASITHELRTPLTSIKLQAEALRDIEDNPKHTPYLHRLLEDVGRLEGQVQQTLELARIEGGGTLSTQNIRIKSHLQSRIIPQYTLNESRLILDLSVEECFIQADPSALLMILRNLFDNSIKYSTQSPTRISLRGKKSNDHYRLQVIHENSHFVGEAGHLGRLFYRGNNSQGAGVGLYLIRTLMTKMGGTAEFVPGNNSFTTQLDFKIEKEINSHEA